MARSLGKILLSKSSCLRHVSELGHHLTPNSGSGNMIAVYNKSDWDEAKAYLNGVESGKGPAPTIAPRMPQEDSTITGSLAPVQTDTAATGTVAPSSGTSSAFMADSTNHVTKWVCKAPYNIPFNLAEGVPLAVICNYLFSWITSRVTGSQDTVV